MTMMMTLMILTAFPLTAVPYLSFASYRKVLPSGGGPRRARRPRRLRAALRISPYIPRAILRARSPPRATLRISNLHPEGDPKGLRISPYILRAIPRGPSYIPRAPPRASGFPSYILRAIPRGPPQGDREASRGKVVLNFPPFSFLRLPCLHFFVLR